LTAEANLIITHALIITVIEDKAIAESLSPLERAIVAAIYSIGTSRIRIPSSEVYRVLNLYLEAHGREKLTPGSFNELLKRLNTAGIIKLRVNRKAINPLDYYWIYKEYPETILSAIFEVDEELKMIQKYQFNLW